MISPFCKDNMAKLLLAMMLSTIIPLATGLAIKPMMALRGGFCAGAIKNEELKIKNGITIFLSIYGDLIFNSSYPPALCLSSSEAVVLLLAACTLVFPKR